MLQHVASRLLQTLVVLLGTSVLVFCVVRVVPGDPVDLMTSPQTPLYLKDQMRVALGLDRPIYVQYGIFLADAVRGNFGTSLRFNKPATRLVFDAFPATLKLTFAALALAILLGVPLGVLAGTAPGSFADKTSMFFAVIGQVIPNFWLGIVLIIVFAVRLHWLPTSGSATWKHLILPAVTLASYNIALVARLTRSGMLEVMRQDYIRTARAKGLSEGGVLVSHALRNALIPIITVIGLQFGTLLGGAIIVETVFAWPGIGTLAVEAIQWRDYAIVQAVVMYSALVFVGINFLLDTVYTWLDPRIRNV